MSDLIPNLKAFVTEVTWSSTLYNPKLQVPNLNPIVLNSTQQGVELASTGSLKGSIHVNIRHISLQLVIEKDSSSCRNCSNTKRINIQSLADAIKIQTSMGSTRIFEIPTDESRKQQFIIETLQSLSMRATPREMTTALQNIASSINRPSEASESASASLIWIQFGVVPRLVSLLLDLTRCGPGVFQLIKNICRSLILYEEILASKAIILYICRALQQCGHRSRSILVLISYLIETPGFRKIAIEHFDLGQNFGRLLLLGKGPSHTSDLTTDNSSTSLNSLIQDPSGPPVHVINKQHHLPIEATLTWRVPPVPIASNPPEESLYQISILKNLLLLSPLNNDGVEFRNGHLTAMLLAFTDRGLAEHFRDQDSGNASARELDDAWFFVFRLVLANIHEHSYHHPHSIPVEDLPMLIMVKPRIELRALEGFIKQVVMMIPVRGNRFYVKVGCRLLTELISSTPSPILVSLVALYLPDLISGIRLSPTQQEVQSGSRVSAHLAVFSLLEQVMKVAQPCPVPLLRGLLQRNLVRTLFQTIGFSSEQKEMNRMDDEEAVVWIQKCWRLLTALVQVFRNGIPEYAENFSPLFIQLEEQLIKELQDPFCFSASDSVDLLASLQFLAVYVNHRECVLYTHKEILIRILRWLRECLNRIWNERDSDLTVACLEVLAVVCANIPEDFTYLLQGFIDGLLYALEWIVREEPTNQGPTIPPGRMVSDRTVRLEARLPEEQKREEDIEWRMSESGPSHHPLKTRRRKKKNLSPPVQHKSEIEPDDISESLMGKGVRIQAPISPHSYDGSADRQDEVLSRSDSKTETDSVQSYPIPYSPSSESAKETIIHKKPVMGTSSKLEDFRAKHELYISQNKTQEMTSVIPPLNLKPLTIGQMWQFDQRSVGSTEYSTDVPTQRLSQISGTTGYLSHCDGNRATSSRPLPMETVASSDLQQMSEARLNAAAEFQDPKSEGSSEMRDNQTMGKVKTASLQYFNQEEAKSLELAKDLIEDESPMILPSRHSTPWNDVLLPYLETDLQPGKLTLEKRANSTSAMSDLAQKGNEKLKTEEKSEANGRDEIMDRLGLYKMHSFGKRRSRPSLAMQQLVGNLSSSDKKQMLDANDDDYGDQNNHLKDDGHYEQETEGLRLWSDRSIPSIAFGGPEMDNSPFQLSEGVPVDMDAFSGTTTITLFAGSDMPDIHDVDVDQLFNEKIEDGGCPKNTADVAALLASKYRLDACELILPDTQVHNSILKVFLKLVWTEYNTRSRECYVAKVISLGLHRHFQHVPKPALMDLKDWAIQDEHEAGCYLLLKLLAMPLFDEKKYLSQKRIGRGVFSSIHECSCPVIGGPTKCCAKVVDLPKDRHDIRSFRDLYIELDVLKRLQHLPQVVRLYDFGCTQDNLYLVTKLYKTDLLSWRRMITGSLLPRAKMLFKVFLEILKTVHSIHQAGVVHFDLKCSNIVLDMDHKEGNMYEWDQNKDQNLPFNVVVADFGEALLVESIPQALHRSRGTQAFMSPEVLVAGSGGRRVAPSISSDTWSLGCLLFELITNKPLFDDSDYSEFHTRLTTTTRTLLDAKRVEWIPELIREPTLLCLSYLLVRNPALRAPIHAVIEWVENLLKSNVLQPTSKIHSIPTSVASDSVRNLRGMEDYSVIPQYQDLEIRGDFIPLSSRVCLLSFLLAKDPWTLSQHQITHVVFVHVTSEEADVAVIRSSAVRATAALFQLQIPSSLAKVEQRDMASSSWMESCENSCSFVLKVASDSLYARLALVPGRLTCHYVQLMARYLSSSDSQSINLDSTLLS